MWDRVTHPARRSLEAAMGEAHRRGAPQLGVEHLLLGILDIDRDPVVPTVLGELTEPIEQLRAEVEAAAATGSSTSSGILPPTDLALVVTRQCWPEAQALGDRHIGNEHLLLAIVTTGGSSASAALEAAGATHGAMLRRLAVARSTNRGLGFRVRTTAGFGRFRRPSGPG